VIRGFVIEHSGGDLNREDSGILLRSNKNNIEGNELRDVLYGIYLFGSSENTIRRNVIRGRAELETGERGAGLHLWNAHNNTIEDNTIAFTRDGMYIQSCTDNKIRRNRVSDLRYGLHYMSSDRNIFEDNFFTDNVAGAAIMYSNKIEFRRNAFIRNRGFSSFGILFQANNNFLLGRSRIQAALRRWFEAERFMEVETSALQVSPGNETHLHGFATELIGADGGRTPLYLHTSPEFACKKLLAAGEPRIVEFARSFRNRERGALHHPEFTLIEWYRTHEPYEALMEDCAAILALAAEAAGTLRFVLRDRAVDPNATPERLTVAEAFARYAGIDLMAVLAPGAAPQLAAAARTVGIRVAGDDTWGDIFSRVLVEKIEPRLGCERATILYEYPAVQSPLARPKASDPRLAERFELYACGVELANGFGELTDVAAQRRRLEEQMEEKQRIYGERYPIDEDFLAALAIMPPASGIALGFDRLVMLATGATRIEQVLWTPLAEL
jgi:lysyl-tRNA synthetase class 2